MSVIFYTYNSGKLFARPSVPDLSIGIHTAHHKEHKSYVYGVLY